METCLMLGANAGFYEQNGLGRAISQEDALAILNQGIDAGLVLQPSNSQNPYVICMCCGCCCLVLKNLNQMDAPAMVANTNYYATIDKDDCIGCGLCVTRCEMDAVSLAQKDASARHAVPANTVEQYMRIARERGLG